MRSPAAHHPAADAPAPPDDTVERAFAAAAADPARLDELLAALRPSRLWLPLPGDGAPAITGGAVRLPLLRYLGQDYVPAYTCATRLLAAEPAVGQAPAPPAADSPAAAPQATRAHAPAPQTAGTQTAGTQAPAPQTAGAQDPAPAATGAPTAGAQGPVPRNAGAQTAGAQALLLRTAGPQATVPYAVVGAVDLARRLPPGTGIALNPGGGVSVPVGPAGVAQLAAECFVVNGCPVMVGPAVVPPGLLAAVAARLAAIPAARQAAAGRLATDDGSGLVLAVWLEDPGDSAARYAALVAVRHGVAAAPAGPDGPVDVTFPGEGEPDVIDRWLAAAGRPFWRRGEPRLPAPRRPLP